MVNPYLSGLGNGKFHQLRVRGGGRSVFTTKRNDAGMLGNGPKGIAGKLFPAICTDRIEERTAVAAVRQKRAVYVLVRLAIRQVLADHKGETISRDRIFSEAKNKLKRFKLGKRMALDLALLDQLRNWPPKTEVQKQLIPADHGVKDIGRLRKWAGKVQRETYQSLIELKKRDMPKKIKAKPLRTYQIGRGQHYSVRNGQRNRTVYQIRGHYPFETSLKLHECLGHYDGHPKLKQNASERERFEVEAQLDLDKMRAAMHNAHKDDQYHRPLKTYYSKQLNEGNLDDIVANFCVAHNKRWMLNNRGGGLIL